MSNENSSVELDCVKNKEGFDVFNRFYVCFDVLRKTWKNNCRPLIGVDGCFLKSKLKGQLLVALGRDADMNIESQIHYTYFSLHCICTTHLYEWLSLLSYTYKSTSFFFKYMLYEHRISDSLHLLFAPLHMHHPFVRVVIIAKLHIQINIIFFQIYAI